MTDQVTRSIIVKGSPNKLYDLWSDFDIHPEFTQDLKHVSRVDEKITRWTIKGPLGKDITWTTETTRDEEACRIAWRTIDGDIKTSGQITFTKMPEDQTQITLIMRYVPPEGLGNLLSKIFDDPIRRIDENLHNFKKYVENKVKA